MLKKIIRKHIQFLVDYVALYEENNQKLEKKVQILEKELAELKETFSVLKSNVSEHKKSKDIGLKQKWLNGYPDESVVKGE
jgi:predicted RNase H-like nuclease (RuvC/YqgF family)